MELFDETPPEAKPRQCDHPDCVEDGLYPAPKDRTHLREYYYFCLDHVREYNKRWDFFAGFSQDQIYSQMRRDTAWERPTWPAMVPLKLEQRLHDFIRKFTKDTHANAPPSKAPLTAEGRALEILGLAPNVDRKAVKARYRELVKRYHPDKNPDNPKAVERFKQISEAYTTLKNIWQGNDK